MISTAANRYAKAFFELSRDKGKSDKVYADLKVIDALIRASTDFSDFIENPTVNLVRRTAIINKIFKGKVDPLSHRFISFLESKQRLGLLKEMYHSFEKFYLTATNTTKVTISSRGPLAKGQMEDIVGTLKARLKKNIDPRVHHDRKMIGGIKIQEGDLIYDYSVKTQLEEFKQRLIRA